MILTTVDFCHHFKTIEGTTLGERRKALFQILKNTQPAEITFESIQPSNYLEDVFKVETLLYFQRFEGLFEYLKQENSNIISKILKNESFFKNAFENITGNFLVASIFPSLSYSTKIKIVRGLSRHVDNTTKIDEYFKCIQEKYGLHMAKMLLNGCSFELVITLVRDGILLPTGFQMLQILKKYKDQREEFLEVLKCTYHINSFHNPEYHTALKYLFIEDTDLCIELIEKYNFMVSLSQKETRIAYDHLKSKIISKPALSMEKYNFNKKGLSKSLKNDTFEFCSNLLPSNMKEFLRNSNFLMFLKGTDSKKFYAILKIFSKTYGKSLLDFPDIISEQILSLAPQNLRQQIAFSKISKAIDQSKELEWYPYVEADNCIAVLKKRISETSDIYIRSSLIGAMVRTCTINKNKVALASICKYVHERHRNDNFIIRSQFFNELQSFDLSQLEEVHWNYINDLIKIFEVNKESFYSKIFEFKYICFRLLHNLDVKEYIEKFISDDIHWLFDKGDLLLQKSYLLICAELLSNFKEEQSSQYKFFSFLSLVLKWNKNYPLEAIPISNYPWILEFLKDFIASNKWYGYDKVDIIKYIFITEHCNSAYNEIRSCYLEKININIERNILRWLIIHQPVYFLNIINPVFFTLLRHRTKQDKSILYICKKYDHLGIPEAFVPLCKEILKIDNIASRVGAIGIFQQFGAPAEFFEIVSEYFPKEKKVDYKDNTATDLYLLQTDVMNSLKQVIPVSSAIDYILKFCEGDYLKKALKSLYSICYRAAENKLFPVFNKLSNSAVSTRKHSIFLAAKVLNKTDCLDTFEKYLKDEKNESLRKYLFFQIFYFFINNPEERTWFLIQQALSNISWEDMEIWNKPLLIIRKIPTGYTVQYILLLWNIYEATQAKMNQIEEAKCSLLNHCISRWQFMTNLPESFCENALNNYFFNFSSQENIRAAAVSFAVRYLLNNGNVEIQEHRLQKLCNIISKRNKDTQEEVDKKIAIKRALGSFSSYLCNHPEINANIIKKFQNYWLHSFKLEECFDEIALLSTLYECKIFSERKLSLEQFAINILKLWESIFVTCGNDIHILRTIVVPRVYVSLNNSNEDVLSFIENILTAGEVITSHVFLVYFLPNIPKEMNCFSKYEKIVRILKNVNDPLLQIHINRILRA